MYLKFLNVLEFCANKTLLTLLRTDTHRDTVYHIIPGFLQRPHQIRREAHGSRRVEQLPRRGRHGNGRRRDQRTSPDAEPAVGRSVDAGSTRRQGSDGGEVSPWLRRWSGGLDPVVGYGREDVTRPGAMHVCGAAGASPASRGSLFA